MTRPSESPAVEPGTPIANALTSAREAIDRGDVTRADRAYLRATGLAGTRDRALWTALAVEHVAELLNARAPGRLAAERCAGYLDGRQDLELLVVQAECLSALGEHAAAGAVVNAIRSRRARLSWDDEARLQRVSGLAAANARDLDRAAHHLTGAAVIFDHLGKAAGLDRIHADLRLIGIRQDEVSAIADALAGPEPRTVAEHFELALALKRAYRYEDAIDVLRRASTLDSSWRFDLLHQLIVLYRYTRQHDVANALLPQLRAAAPDHEAGEAMLAEVSTVDPEEGEPTGFDQVVNQARRLIVKERLDEADRLLREHNEAARSDRDIATWHLAAGELWFTRGRLDRDQAAFEQAVGHLGAAVDATMATAAGTALTELRITALRLRGQACYRLEADDEAMRCWAEATESEDGIARRQRSDRIRVNMLKSVRSGYDEWIDAAAAAGHERGAEQAVGLVVALEAARGSTILDRILPSDRALLRSLPRPHDLDLAWRWIDLIVHGLPRSQAVWLMHCTPHQLHHVILGDGVFRTRSIACERAELEESVNQFKAMCSMENVLTASFKPGTSGEPARFDARIEDLAARVGIREVLPLLGAGIRRIAIVAGGTLSDIPFAAMRVPGGAELIGHRYALSDLPCLSARLPLRSLSHTRRGRGRLRVVPPGERLARNGKVRARKPLRDERATRENLCARLNKHHYRQVRIDGHGVYDHTDPSWSWLALAPEGPEGHLRSSDLERLDLRGCGTLMLGACESGMAQRVGRDERIGFVRAGFHAGAAAVIAARWKAHDRVAGAVLDRYERYVRYLPRDVALWRAQLDICRAARGTPADVPLMEHPARWACWTLYGDSGWETGAGAAVRLIRRVWDSWRRCAVLR